MAGKVWARDLNVAIIRFIGHLMVDFGVVVQNPESGLTGNKTCGSIKS